MLTIQLRLQREKKPSDVQTEGCFPHVCDACFNCLVIHLISFLFYSFAIFAQQPFSVQRKKYVPFLFFRHSLFPFFFSFLFHYGFLEHRRSFCLSVSLFVFLNKKKRVKGGYTSARFLLAYVTCMNKRIQLASMACNTS